MILLPAGDTLVKVCVLPGPGASAASGVRRSVLQAAIVGGGWRTLGTCPGETRYRRVYWPGHLGRSVPRDRRWLQESPSSPGLPGRCPTSTDLRICTHSPLSSHQSYSAASIHGGLWSGVSCTRQDSLRDGIPDRTPAVIAVLPVHLHLSCLHTVSCSLCRPRHGPKDCPWRGPRVDCRIGSPSRWSHSDNPSAAVHISRPCWGSHTRLTLGRRHIGDTPPLSLCPGKHMYTRHQGYQHTHTHTHTNTTYGTDLKMKLSHWCPGALGYRTSDVIWCLKLQLQIANAILFFSAMDSQFKYFTLHDTVTSDFIKCFVILSTWSEPQTKALVRAKPSTTPVIGGHHLQHVGGSRTRL